VKHSARVDHAHTRLYRALTVGVAAVAVLSVGFAIRTLSAGAPDRPHADAVAAVSGGLTFQDPQFGYPAYNGQSQSANITVVNTSTSALHITSMVLGGHAQMFSATAPDTCTGADLPEGAYCVFGIKFTAPIVTQPTPPPPVGEAIVSVSTSIGGFETVVTVNQNTVFYGLNANPTPLNFGSTVVGSTSAPRSTTIGDEGSDTGMRGLLGNVALTGADAGDYSLTADACSNTILAWDYTGPSGSPVPQHCGVSVVQTPSAAGSRPAWLDVSYCPSFIPGLRIHAGPGVPQSSAAAAQVSPRQGSQAQAPGPVSPATPDPTPMAPVCNPNAAGPPVYSLHRLVPLNGAGLPPTTSPPPTTPVTTRPVTPSPVTTPVFTPTLTTNPMVVPGGRTTQVSGTGFPASSPVVIAMRMPGTPLITDPTLLAALPQAIHAVTDGTGAFTDQTLVVMPHTPAGTYPLEAICTGPSGTVTTVIDFLVVPGTEQPPQFVNRH
jgi:hypothetical protein